MLIYNVEKKFIGIDQEDLTFFGFTNLAQLQAQSADFADLFLHTPGHIHNFKHVHWIDYIACAEPSELSKVIISVNSGLFSANLQLDTIFLSDFPNAQAYCIRLNDLRTISSDEFDKIIQDVKNKPIPEAIVGKNLDDAPKEELSRQRILSPQPILEQRIPSQESIQQEYITHPPEAPNKKYQVNPAIQVAKDEEYSFDPLLASEELGLPIDLIEEFIEDFIAQAYEFENELYNSLNDGNIKNISKLSHKLKGVAANLRVENALNTLSIINSSDDAQVIETNLHIFYKIIADLSKYSIKEVKKHVSSTIENTQEIGIKKVNEPIYDDDDDLILEFKDEPLEIGDDHDEIRIKE